MALVVNTLKSQLENNWLVPEGGTFPGSAAESAKHFASAVASWFSAAQANGFPCGTASARQGQLSGQLVSAFQAGSATAAAQGMASALAAYIAGQSFGAGVASPPAGIAAAASMLTTALSTLELDPSTRAQQIAQACQTLALTTVVTFPPPMPPANVL
jgi:hypothetical protein